MYVQTIHINVYTHTYVHRYILYLHLENAVKITAFWVEFHLLFDAVGYWHVLHRHQRLQLCQTVHKFDLLTELGAVDGGAKMIRNRGSEGVHTADVSGHTHLMKGLVSASRVRINQEGWTMIRDFRFFRNLRRQREELKHPGASFDCPVDWIDRLTCGQSADSTCAASRRSASFYGTSPRLNTQSCSSRPPGAPACRSRTWRESVEPSLRLWISVAMASEVL